MVAGIDQGTTGTTVLIVGGDESILGRGYREIPQSFPAPGQVEHDPQAIWASVVGALADACGQAGAPEIAAVGVTNQRETTVLWERATGRPVAPAIVWQDRRTAPACEALKQGGKEARVHAVTGLLLDPYFSATKITWLLDHMPGLRSRAERGEIAFGTIDSYLVFRLSGGRKHVTDVSNASRTLLFDLATLNWSEDMCRLFRVPQAVLPEVVASAGLLADTVALPGLRAGTPISGIAGDQQAALFGQGCTLPGDAKCTYDTGSFLLMNIGAEPIFSQRRLLTTVAWEIADRATYALEGSAFVSGALVQWLATGLGVIDSVEEIEPLARSVSDAGGVTIVPALAGLGAPHWRPEARGLITGLTRGTTKAHIARAALDAMALQNVELVRAMEADTGRRITSLRVDGGAAANDLLMQIQADLLGVDIVRPAFVELTALGAARLAAHGAGFVPWDEEGPVEPTAATRFHPNLSEDKRQEMLSRWQKAVDKA